MTILKHIPMCDSIPGTLPYIRPESEKQEKSRRKAEVAGRPELVDMCYEKAKKGFF